MSLMKNRLPAILLTLGLVAWLQEIVTIEWSFPYCSDQADGPASAVFGMPLPYVRWSTVSSMEYLWMPAVLVLNLLILFVVFYPLVAWAVGALRRALINVRAADTAILLVGAFLVVTFVGLNVFLISAGIYKVPVWSIAREGRETYLDFRPVSVGLKKLRYDCTPMDR